jgi:Holliday junction resolvasome RuvABC ATP-dependent DNA helicase subunit
LNPLESHLINILERYSREGPWSADNLIDEVASVPSFGESIEIQALRSIIQSELDPLGKIIPLPPSHLVAELGLSKAICCWATALRLSPEFPLQARESALEVIKCLQSSEFRVFPEAWIKEAEKLILHRNPPKKLVSLDQRASMSDRWAQIERVDSKAPQIIRESIMPMIGLEAVKENLLNAYNRIRLAKEQEDGAAASYNIRFEGKPGTGKTTICRHYGKFLQQLSVLPDESIFKETNGSKLINDGVKGLQDILKDVKKAGGGVIFVDEAYQLASDTQGKKVLDFILPLAENLESDEYGKLVWVFAGYKKPMEKLFEHSEGLPSRFPQRFVFEDYTDDELQSIFQDLIEYTTSYLPEKPTSIQPPPKRSRPQYSYGGSRASPGSVQTDRYGRQWTYDHNYGWTDEFRNNTVEPSQVGSASSPLVGQDGQMWTENGGVWSDDSGKSQNHYPGDSPPSTKKLRRNFPFQCDSSHLLIAIRRLGRRRSDKGFGNARAVRVLFDQVRDRQAARITEERGQGKNPDIFRLDRADFLGPDISEDTLKNSQAWRELEHLEGLVPVKQSVRQLFNVVLNNVEREKRDEPLYKVTLNRLFLGNCGTGKTTVAEIYGKILVELGLLSKGEVILKCASDFIGDVLGSSEKTTRNILQAAEGNALVIDEAYSLYSGGRGPTNWNDPYKTAVIDTIVEQVQAKPGADIAVVLLGYKEEMEHMMGKVNPGLARRFQLEDAFIFPDFDDASLLRILLGKARNQGLELGIDIAKRAVRALAKARARPNFGNAGAVDNILSKAVQRMADRNGDSALSVDDFGYAGDDIDDNALANLFADLIGCDEVRAAMEELRCTVEFSKSRGRPAKENISFNYLFLGSPGTGRRLLLAGWARCSWNLASCLRTR